MLVDVKVYSDEDTEDAIKILSDMGYNTWKLKHNISIPYPTFIRIDDSDLQPFPISFVVPPLTSITLKGLKDLKHGYDKGFKKFGFTTGLFDFDRVRKLQQTTQISNNLVKAFASGGTNITFPNGSKIALDSMVEKGQIGIKGVWNEDTETPPIPGATKSDIYCSCNKRTPKRTSTSVGAALTEENTYYICTNCKKEIK